MKRFPILLLLLLLTPAGLAAAEPAPRKPMKVVLWLGGFAHDFKSVGAILSEVLPRQIPLKMRVVWIASGRRL